MSCPRTAAQLTIAVLYDRGYPRVSSLGIMMLPMHATAEEQVPDIAPNIA
jgi:hypothetical protein